MFVHRSDGQLDALCLVEVDDFMIASSSSEVQAWLKSCLQGRFKFGKWEDAGSEGCEFIGRRIFMMPNGEIHLSQEKYILEKLAAVEISKGRRGKKEDVLNEKEFADYRSMLYRISWVAHQTRPEVAGGVSILASRLHQATVSDLILLNKMVGHLRSSAKQALRIRPFEPSTMTFIGVSDCGGVDGEVRTTGEDGLIQDPVQGAWLVMASNLLPSHDRRVGVSVLSWRSSKLKRRVTSTMAGETLAMSQCLAELEWLQIFYRDLNSGDVNTGHWHKSLSPFVAMLPDRCALHDRQEQCCITDAKSLYDALYKQCPSSRQDRRNALELAVVVDVMKKTGAQIRWTPHQRMPVDMLTNADILGTNGALLHLLRSASLRIDKEDEELFRRQREKSARLRSRRASDKLLEEEAEAEEFFQMLTFLVCQLKVGGAVNDFHQFAC